jgi:hypothetical protein
VQVEVQGFFAEFLKILCLIRNKTDFVDLQQFAAFCRNCEENTAARDSDPSSHRTDVYFCAVSRTEVDTGFLAHESPRTPETE